MLNKIGGFIWFCLCVVIDSIPVVLIMLVMYAATYGFPPEHPVPEVTTMTLTPLDTATVELANE